jgi:transposase
MNNITASSVIVGVDVHKYSHTAVALDAWGQEKGKLEFTNDNLPEYMDWLSSFCQKSDMLVALEDINSYGTHLVRALTGSGFRIRYVPAILTERERKQSTKRHKSDLVDARRVGKVILTKYEETLPAKESIADEAELVTAQTLNLLLMERRDLVKQKTILKNQLHALLHQYYGDHYADNFSKPFHKKAIVWYQSDLMARRKQGDVSAREQILGEGICRRLHRLVMHEEQIFSISKDIEKIGASAPSVVALSEKLHGCGMITSCSIMAEVTTIKRFNSKDKLAMYSGVAPTKRSSGSHNKLHTNPFGNRRLNKALHVIALSQIACKGDDRGKVYYQRKIKEGKTKLWALRCLKRQIANQVFKILKENTT